MKFSINYHIVLFALLLLGVNKNGFAEHDPTVSERWEGAQVTVNNVYNIQDDKWPNISPPATVGFTNVKATTDVILGVELGHPSFQAQAYDVEVDVRATYQGDAPFSTSVDQTLSVNYDPARGSVMEARSSFQLPDAHFTDILILAIRVNGVSQTNLPVATYLEGLVNVERYYDFDCTVPLSFNLPLPTVTVQDAGSGTLKVSWPSRVGAEEYDLEWTFVDNSDGNGGVRMESELDYDFRHNAGRVTVDTTVFFLNRLYPRGHLIFRLRGVGRSAQDPQQRLEGVWNLAESGTVNNVPNVHKHTVTTGHQENLNWQLSINYAEEGKKKEVVSYHDGSLRGRQTVTQISSDETAVIAETVYDNYGRPAVQILPTPDDEDKVFYRDNFNQNNTGDPYNWENFAEDGVSCDASADAMATNSGASRYYSPLNTDQDGAQAFVPDAESYPFSQVEYTPDNTGRIRRQSGVGPDHQLGSNHESKYFYGVPFQVELDRLFGNDVGDAIRYKKEMMVDPNGQPSVTYKDAHGRTIATALAGTAPPALDAVPSNTGASPMAVNLSDKNELNQDGTSLVISQEILVSTPGDYTFTYDITPETFQASDCDGVDLCLDCVYDLTISVKNECGEEMLSNGVVTETIGPFQNIDGTCNADATFSLGQNNEIQALALVVGSYKVVKTLTVNADALEAYLALRLANDNCLRTLDDFVQEAIDTVDLSGCNIDPCRFNCELSVGSFEDFGGTQAAYDQAIADCKAECATASYCEGFLEILKYDVSPGGQYALYEDENGVRDLGLDLSIFNLNGNDLQGTWKTPVGGYKNEDGTDAFVNGVAPENLSLDDFIENWQTSWANALVTFHPQYCEYDWCIANSESFAFDIKILEIDDLQQAIDSGWISNTGDLLMHTINDDDGDPFFQAGGQGSLDRPDMITKAGSYQDCGSDSYSITELAYVMANCQGDAGDCVAIGNCLGTNSPFNDVCTSTAEWLTLRALYLAAKNDFVQQRKAAYLGAYPNGTVANDRYCSVDFSLAIFEGKENRFPTSDELINFDPNLFTDPVDLAAVEAASQAQFQQHCDLICSGYEDAWREQLEQCPDYVAASATTQDQIIIAFTEICSNSGACNGENPLGSSNLPPGQTNSFGDNSFQDVLERVLGIGPDPEQELECHASLISMPRPLGSSYSASSQTLPILDTCACSSILENQLRFDDMQAAGTLPEGVSNPERLFEVTFGVELIDYNGKKCACDDAFPGTWQSGDSWPIAAVENLESEAIPINANVSCPVCVSCGPVAAIFNHYARNTLTLELAALVTNTLNTTLGFNLTFEQYQEFYDDCVEAGSGGNDQDLAKGCLLTYDHESLDELMFISVNDAAINPLPNDTDAATYPDGRDITAMAYNPNVHELYAFSGDCANPKRRFYRISFAGGQTQIDFVNAIFPPEAATGVYGAAYDHINGVLYAVAVSGNVQTLCSVNPSTGAFSPIGTIGLTATLASNGNDNCALQGDGINGLTFVPSSGQLIAAASNKLYNINPANGSHSFIGNTPSSSIRGLAMNRANQKLYAVTQTGTTYELNPNTGALISSILTSTSTSYHTSLAFVDNVTCSALECTFNPAACTSCQSGGNTLFDENFNGLADGTQEVEGEWYTTFDQACTNTSNSSVQSSAFRFESCGTNGSSTSLVTVPIDISDIEALRVRAGLYSSSKDGKELISLWAKMDGGIPILVDQATANGGNVIFDQTLQGLFNNSVEFFVEVESSSSTSFVQLNRLLVEASNNCIPLQLCNEALFEQVTLADDCAEYQINLARHYAEIAYGEYIESISEDFTREYIATCLDAAELEEEFVMNYDDNQYHYTLYYYDQAGSLVKTIPPEGLDLPDQSELMQIADYRNTGVGSPLYLAHRLPTYYRYNTLGEPVWQETPDGGVTQFWYDRLGRPVISQDATQATEQNYFYTQYDNLGRVVEAGEMNSTGAIDEDIARNNADLQNFINGGAVSTRTLTYYEESFDPVVAALFPGGQTHLRNRVASVKYEDLNDAARNALSHYSYDIHGNVKSLIQEFPDLAHLGPDQQYKRIDYKYDLISGNIIELAYQAGKPDQYFHRFEYDADNRLTFAHTTKDNINVDQDARYFYYKHGPLARVEIGDEQVQGLDYAYTIHGWIKAVNSGTIGQYQRDMGKDGWDENGTYTQGYEAFNPGIHQDFARDAYGFTLNYYEGDYQGIRSWDILQQPEPSHASSYLGNSLYNGNINHMLTALTDVNGQAMKHQATVYQYDQLNRLKKLNVWRDANVEANNIWTNPILSQDYQTTIEYDANGNIEFLQRNGASPLSTSMDNMRYKYERDASGKLISNKLQHVNDVVAPANYPDDFEDQGAYVANDPSTHNYSYDERGNLIQDKAEEIDEIVWTAEGKIKEIIRTAGSTKPNLEFRYDASGNRIVKIVKNSPDEVDWDYTYYVRDAAGQMLAVYNREYEEVAGSGGGGGGNGGGGTPVTIFTEGFETGVAGWAQSTTDDFDWTRWTGSTGSTGTGPTSAVEGSYYIYTEASNPNNPTKTAIITSPAFDLSSVNSANLNFQYHINASGLPSLYVEASTDGIIWTTIYSQVNVDIGNFWNTASPSLDVFAGQSTVYIRFRGETGTNFLGDIGIDDVSVTGIQATGPANCSATINAFPYFNGLNGDTGDWTQDTDDDINFAFSNSTTPSSGTGPAAPYEGFMYAFTEATQNFNKVASMTSPCYDLSGETSASWDFHYHMYDAILNSNHMGTLEAQASTDGTTWTTLWSRSGNQGNAWLPANVSLNTYAGSIVQLRLRATTGPGFRSDISLDAINVTVGGGGGGPVTFKEHFTANEYHLYGSSRLGIHQQLDSLARIDFGSAGFGTDGRFTGISPTETELYALNLGEPQAFLRGAKRYELSNHLGNVLEVISDRKIAVNNGGTVDHYLPDILKATDYYAFGLPMIGRDESISPGTYRFDFNGKETDAETDLQDYGFRIYNPSIAKFLSVDPLAPEYPWYTPYQFAGNNPVKFIDRDGLEPTTNFKEYIYKTRGHVIVVVPTTDDPKFAEGLARKNGVVQGQSYIVQESPNGIYMIEYQQFRREHFGGFLETSWLGSEVTRDSRVTEPIEKLNFEVKYPPRKEILDVVIGTRIQQRTITNNIPSSNNIRRFYSPDFRPYGFSFPAPGPAEYDAGGDRFTPQLNSHMAALLADPDGIVSLTTTVADGPTTDLGRGNLSRHNLALSSIRALGIPDDRISASINYNQPRTGTSVSVDYDVPTVITRTRTINVSIPVTQPVEVESGGN